MTVVALFPFLLIISKLVLSLGIESDDVYDYNYNDQSPFSSEKGTTWGSSILNSLTNGVLNGVVSTFLENALDVTQGVEENSQEINAIDNQSKQSQISAAVRKGTTLFGSLANDLYHGTLPLIVGNPSAANLVETNEEDRQGYERREHYDAKESEAALFNFLDKLPSIIGNPPGEGNANIIFPDKNEAITESIKTAAITPLTEIKETTKNYQLPEHKETTSIMQESEETTLPYTDSEETATILLIPDIKESTKIQLFSDNKETTTFLQIPYIEERTTILPIPDIEETTTIIPIPDMEETTTILPVLDITETTTILPIPKIEETTTFQTFPVNEETTTIQTYPENEETTTILPFPDNKETTTLLSFLHNEETIPYLTINDGQEINKSLPLTTSKEPFTSELTAILPKHHRNRIESSKNSLFQQTQTIKPINLDELTTETPSYDRKESTTVRYTTSKVMYPAYKTQKSTVPIKEKPSRKLPNPISQTVKMNLDELTTKTPSYDRKESTTVRYTTSKVIYPAYKIQKSTVSLKEKPRRNLPNPIYQTIKMSATPFPWLYRHWVPENNKNGPEDIELYFKRLSPTV